MKRRTICQPATLVGGIGAITMGVCPPIGVLLLIAAFFIQRSYSQSSKGAIEAARRRAYERQQQVRILAIKSLR